MRPAAVATDIWETSGVPKEMLPALVQMEAAKQPCTGMLTAEEIAQEQFSIKKTFYIENEVKIVDFY